MSKVKRIFKKVPAYRTTDGNIFDNKRKAEVHENMLQGLVNNKSPLYIGASIRYLRQLKGINQGDLAKYTGLSRTSICNIEASRQGTYNTLLAILKTLDAELIIRPKSKINV